MLEVILGVFVFLLPFALVLSAAKSPEGRIVMAAVGVVFVLLVVAVYGKGGWILSWFLLWPFGFVAGGVAAVIRSNRENIKYRRKYSKQTSAKSAAAPAASDATPDTVNAPTAVTADQQTPMLAPTQSAHYRVPPPANAQPHAVAVTDPLAARLHDVEARLQKARKQTN